MYISFKRILRVSYFNLTLFYKMKDHKIDKKSNNLKTNCKSQFYKLISSITKKVI